LSIDPSIVESERGVVLVNVVQVLKILLGDCYRNPCRQLLFKNIHWPVMGYEDDMKKIGTNKTWSVILKHTMHQITVVVVSGAIKTEEVKRLAQKYLEPIPAQPAPPKVHIVEPVQTGERITVQK
jgi:predicted Zn-dependent peptidase